MTWLHLLHRYIDESYILVMSARPIGIAGVPALGVPMSRRSSSSAAFAVVVSLGTTAMLTFSGGCKFPYPPDVPDDDVAEDGGPFDAATDGAIDAAVRMHPLVENNQAADLIIGQRDFTSDENLPVGPQMVLYAMGIAGDRDNVWISDIVGVDRATRFSPFPAMNFPAAIGVVGRADFTNAIPVGAPTAANLSSPGGVALTANALIIVDTDRNRVLVWSPRPISNGAPADLVLGQTNFSGASAGTAADKLNEPAGVWSDGSRLVVSDRGNHRVLVWNTMPVANGQPADIVVGQPSFSAGAPPAQPSASRMRRPNAITSDGRWLAVSDAGHSRVLIWKQFPATSGAAADVVVGQDSFDLAVDGMMTAQRFYGVTGLANADGALFVADREHRRVLVFDPVPSISVGDVSSASQALGQVNPGVLNAGGPITNRSLNIPHAIAIVDRYLFVAEWSGHRVLRFRLALP